MPPHLTRRSRLHIIAMIGTLAVVAAPAPAQDNPAKTAYLRYCAACHGETGKGDGLVSTFLRPKPTDLTQIAKTHGGEFPTAWLTRVIDGRQEVGAHGKADMPVWGEVFREEAGEAPAAEAMVRSKVGLINEYVRTLQAK